MNIVLHGHIVPGIYTAAAVKEAGCVILDTLAGTKIRVMWVEPKQSMKGRAGHMVDEEMGMVMVNDAKVILADQTDTFTGIFFHGVDKVILPGSAYSECPGTSSTVPPAPTEAPKSSAFAHCFNNLALASVLGMIALL